MTQPNPSTAMARVVVDELARGGVGLVVVSPGSRSAALAIAAASHELIETRVVLDERSAAFYALGRAKVSGGPVALVCTSGTAVANYLPGVVEASMALVPLVVLSADRPAELQGVGANQTIDQGGLFGRFVRSSVHFDAPTGEHDDNGRWRSMVCEALDAALGAHDSNPGPVHLNLAFREPTVPVPDDGREVAVEYPFPIDGKPGGRRWLEGETVEPAAAELDLPLTNRAMVIAGEGRYDRDALAELVSSLGWPLLATAASDLRRPGVVDAYEWLLADGVPAHLQPEVTYVVGGIGPSRRLEMLASSAILAQVRIDADGRVLNPSLNATSVLAGDPVETLRSAAPAAASPEWTDVWAETQTRVADAVDAAIRSQPVSGPSVAEVANRISWDVLVAASSLPIRDVDATLRRREGRLIANRGASGIDGFVSTSLGAASAGGRSLALAGDLSVFHDSNGFLIAGGHDLVVVVVNNRGGGLFDLLPQAVHAPSFEELFITPQDRDLAGLAAFHGIEHVAAERADVLEAEVAERLDAGGVHMVEVVVDRATDVAVRAELDRVGVGALGSGQA